MPVWDLLDKEKYVDEAIRDERLEVCLGANGSPPCPFLFRPTEQCRLCTCFVKAKAKLNTEDCPKGWWIE